MEQEVLISISLIITIAAALTIIARMIKQPPIIAYLISGIIVGPLALNLIGTGNASAEMMQTFARIGVAFLLFIVGLSLDFRLLKEIGKVSTVSGLIEIVGVGTIGFLVAFGLGFSNLASLYIGAAIAFSSTVVVVKILSDKREMETLHGKIALGILIIQDIVASIFLMIIPLLNNQGNIITILKDIGLGILLIGFVFILAGLVFSKFLNYLAKSQETLFIFGIAWALVLAALFNKLGFSIEIGALIAGMSLASSKYALDLEGKMKPLRDFFVVLFFVFFGSQLAGPLTIDLIGKAVIFSIVVIVLKPLFVMTILKFFGYTKRTNFLTSISLAQVSEFSLILILLGFGLGHLNQEVMNLAILIALITIGLSAYTIHASSYLSDKLLGFFSFFDGKVYKDEKCKKKDYEIILLGYHRIGYKLLENIKKMRKSFVIVDYNPKVVLSLIKQKINAIYGDAGSQNFLEELNVSKAKMIISTIPDEHTNLMVLETLKNEKSDAVFIGTAEEPRIALDLYNAGADFVLIPHHLGGDYASQLVKTFGIKKENYKRMGKAHKHNLDLSRNSSTFD